MQCLSMPNRCLEFWSASVRSDSCNHLMSFCQRIKWIKLMTAIPERTVFTAALNHNLTHSWIGSVRQSNKRAGWIKKNTPILADEHSPYEQCAGMPVKLTVSRKTEKTGSYHSFLLEDNYTYSPYHDEMFYFYDCLGLNKTWRAIRKVGNSSYL